MFTKPYRTPLHKNEDASAELWVNHEVEVADPALVKSLQSYLNNLSITTPPRRTSTTLSFKYENTSDYIFRNIAYEHVVTNTLLNTLFEDGFNLTLNKIIKRIDVIERFMNNSSTISQLLNDGSNKSMVITLKPNAKSISAISYIDIFYDNLPNILILDKPIGNSIQKERIRNAASFRLHMKPTEAKFSINKESNHCIFSIEHELSVNLDNKRFSQFKLDSTEYNFELYYNDIESLVLKFLQGCEEHLSKKLDYTVTEVDQSMIDLIDMSIY